MSEKIELTEGMLIAAAERLGVPLSYIEPAVESVLAHPSFQSQLRAYVAGEMRGLVALPLGNKSRYRSNYEIGYDDGIEDTLANIAAYEKQEN